MGADGELSGMAGRVVLRTARLVLRPYAADDVEALHRVWTDPGVRRYLWDDRVISRETADAVVEGSLADWATRGYGQWVVTVPPAAEVIGFVGFRSGEGAEAVPELLYGLLPGWWGRGLADEAARAALAHGFEALGFATIWAATNPPNTASIRLMERLGMTFQRRDRLQSLEAVVYTLAAEEFARAHVVRLARADEVAHLPAIEAAAGELLRALGLGGDSQPLAPSLAALERACAAGRLWIVATGAGRLAGFAYVKLLDGQPHLEEIDVLPVQGRRGLGTALLTAVIAWARQADFPALTLTAFRDVPWNAPFYRRLGFRDLDPPALPPVLTALVADEERRGLPRAQRVVMRLDLGDPVA